MRKLKLLPALITAAVIALGSVTVPTTASASPGLNVQIEGFFPAPPEVRIYQGGGRPYYVRHNRRVYMERDRRHHRDNRRRGHEYRERENCGHYDGRGR